MNIVYMNGGLGNQMCQYIFLRWLALRTKEKCIIDNSKFCGKNVPHNGYELERLFGIRLEVLSDLFEPADWQSMIERQDTEGISVLQQLTDAGLEINVCFDPYSKNFKYEGESTAFSFWDWQPPSAGGLNYYYGYWIGRIFFEPIKGLIRSEFAFPVFTDEKNLAYQDEITNAKHSAAIHVRRGDMAILGWTQPPEYFRRTIAEAEATLDIDRYFLFSDDLPWCREFAPELGLDTIAKRVTEVTGNFGQNAWKDMKLMSLCRTRITDRSSFSYVAKLLCRHEDPHDYNNWNAD